MNSKIILITGATDGIGLETARMLATHGHHLLLHGRSQEKLDSVRQELNTLSTTAKLETYQADLSSMQAVNQLASNVLQKHSSLDILINNAGVFMSQNTNTPEGIDIRFAVNTLAPYLLTKRLLTIMSSEGRVINLSSAAQSTVNIDALKGRARLSDNDAYAQSKLAITMWSRKLATDLGRNGPAIIAVNPGSFLGSKMVREAYGREGRDIAIGANILAHAALSDEFSSASGRYYDNDTKNFGIPHPDVFDVSKCVELTNTLDEMTA